MFSMSQDLITLAIQGFVVIISVYFIIRFVMFMIIKIFGRKADTLKNSPAKSLATASSQQHTTTPSEEPAKTITSHAASMAREASNQTSLTNQTKYYQHLVPHTVFNDTALEQVNQTINLTNYLINIYGQIVTNFKSAPFKALLQQVLDAQYQAQQLKLEQLPSIGSPLGADVLDSHNHPIKGDAKATKTQTSAYHSGLHNDLSGLSHKLDLVFIMQHYFSHVYLAATYLQDPLKQTQVAQAVFKGFEIYDNLNTQAMNAFNKVDINHKLDMLEKNYLSKSLTHELSKFYHKKFSIASNSELLGLYQLTFMASCLIAIDPKLLSLILQQSASLLNVNMD